MQRAMGPVLRVRAPRAPLVRKLRRAVGVAWLEETVFGACEVVKLAGRFEARDWVLLSGHDRIAT